jgi:hypothetical protein
MLIMSGLEIFLYAVIKGIAVKKEQYDGYDDTK